MVQTQTEAKRFFVDKVLRQAHAEGVRLSEAEHQMLSWSESDPDFVVDPQLPGRLASEMSDEAYEKKIGERLPEVLRLTRRRILRRQSSGGRHPKSFAREITTSWSCLTKRLVAA